MRPIAAFALAVLVLTACGKDESAATAPEPGPGRWHVEPIAGLRRATGVAAVGRGLLLTTDGAVFALPRPTAGATLEAKAVPLSLDAEAHLTGGDELAARGYRIGDLWDRARDLGGVAVQPPDHVFLLERTYRIVYAGRVVLGGDGLAAQVRLERAFTVPGADRQGAEASDWRDRGPGAQGLTTFGSARPNDLFVLEAGGAGAETFRIRALDRYGSALQHFDVTLPGGATAVLGLAAEGERFLAVHGEGRGLLVPFKVGRWREIVAAGRGVPGPPLETGRWQGLATDAEGALYLVSDGTPSRLAWRDP